MQIKIAERLKPFCHIPGIFFILPNSSLRARIFPTKIYFDDLSQAQPKFLGEVSLNFDGPVNEFTAQQDLEKGCLRVWGQTEKGYFRYELWADQESSCGCKFVVDKVPGNFSCKPITDSHFRILFQNEKISSKHTLERLSLGNHKAQDWNKMRERCDMKEIFPLWLHLGQLCQISNRPALSHCLLDVCHELIKKKDINNIISSFTSLFKAGFDFGLSPRLLDSDYYGFPAPPVENASPIFLLSEGSKLIRSLFIQQKQDSISILPVLPPQFHCGRFIQLCCGTSGSCDIEWSKKSIRRLIFSATETRPLSFHFQKEVKEFRLRLNESEICTSLDQGWSIGKTIQCGAPIEVKEGQKYFLDNFK